MRSTLCAFSFFTLGSPMGADGRQAASTARRPHHGRSPRAAASRVGGVHVHDRPQTRIPIWAIKSTIPRCRMYIPSTRKSIVWSPSFRAARIVKLNRIPTYVSIRIRLPTRPPDRVLTDEPSGRRTVMPIAIVNKRYCAALAPTIR